MRCAWHALRVWAGRCHDHYLPHRYRFAFCRSHKKGSELHDADEEDTKRGAGAKQPVATGDALEDDFGSDLEIDDEEAALSAADKRRRQKRLDKERKKKRDAAAR